MDKIGQRAASVKRKRIISLLICMLLVLNVVCLTGCGAGKKWKDGKCTISIECSSILDNMEDLKETKKEFVPSDGWILKETEVSFKGGETAFDVLKQICGKKESIWLPDIPLCIKVIMWRESISFTNSIAVRIRDGCTV